jgi:hypothetical protein
MSEWDATLKTRAMKIDSLKKFIPTYDYSSYEMAHTTDENLCSLVTEKLGLSKKAAFNVLETAFELHKELPLKDFEGLRDEIDVFSDEIRARVFKWSGGKTRNWLGRLVDYDYRILTGLGNLLRGIEGLHMELLSSGRVIQDYRTLNEHTGRLKERLDEIVMLFRERDAVCNIGEAALERSFAGMRTRIRKGFGP